jgi:hypothetical protein
MERTATAAVMPGRVRPTTNAGGLTNGAWVMARPQALLRTRNRLFKIIYPLEVEEPLFLNDFGN